mmetsp:Transcript_69649/g.138098  ORF Transcript_69649/g.138098 Transcript_69649/m.138098 type:complete len:110 (-) Transcript_69649:344-673(-)
MQISHDRNLPLFGVARIECSGGCECECVWSHHGAFNSSCYFDGLLPGGHVSVTAFNRLFVTRRNTTAAKTNTLGCAPGQCAVTVRNVEDPKATRKRVIVRAHRTDGGLC